MDTQRETIDGRHRDAFPRNRDFRYLHDDDSGDNSSYYIPTDFQTKRRYTIRGHTKQALAKSPGCSRLLPPHRHHHTGHCLALQCLF